MKFRNYFTETTLRGEQSKDGETIEQQIERMQNNGADTQVFGSPLIFTEKAQGVISMYDIRADKWEEALTAREGINRATITKKVEEMKREAAEGNDRLDQEK